MAANESPPSRTQGVGPSSLSVHFERERGVTEIQVTRGIAHVTVRFSRKNLADERLALLQALGAASISLFLIKLHPDAISFAVRSESQLHEGGDAVAHCEAVLRARGSDYVLLRDLGLVAVVAGAMRDLSGVMARIYRAMVESSVRVRQTGDAYNAVLCLVGGDEADRAADALRRTFALEAAQENRPPLPGGGGAGLKPL